VSDDISLADGAYPLIALSTEGTLVYRKGATGALLARYQLVWMESRRRPVARGRQVDVPARRLVATPAGRCRRMAPPGHRLATEAATTSG
jgi:hypothetical protein